MTPNPQAAIHHKCRELILLLQINLNHFPRHEKYGLCQEIRQCVYGVLAGIVECQKRYHTKPGLTKLDGGLVTPRTNKPEGYTGLTPVLILRASYLA